MRKLMLVTALIGLSVLTATAAGAADYPATSGSLDVSQDGSSVTTVNPGDSVTVSGSGFAPGASVQVTIASTPRLLTTVSANGAGAMSATVTIPTDIESGSHTLSATGADPNGGTLVLSRTITVPGAAGSGTGATVFGRTGANSAALAVAGLGVVALGWLFVVVTRRRRAASPTV